MQTYKIGIWKKVVREDQMLLLTGAKGTPEFPKATCGNYEKQSVVIVSYQR